MYMYCMCSNEYLANAGGGVGKLDYCTAKCVGFEYSIAPNFRWSKNSSLSNFDADSKILLFWYIFSMCTHTLVITSIKSLLYEKLRLF